MKRLLTLASLTLALLVAPSANAEGFDVEVGVQSTTFNVTTAGFAPYAQVRYNAHLARVPGTTANLWALPEVGVTLGPTANAYVRLQVLLDTPSFTLGVDTKAFTNTAPYARAFLRFSF